MPTARIDNDDLEPFLCEHVDTVGRNDHRIGLRVAAVKRDSSFCVWLTVSRYPGRLTGPYCSVKRVENEI